MKNQEQDRVQHILADPKKALFRLAWPIILGMTIELLYNIVDTAFVGRLGTEAIAAVTFTFPIFLLFIALSVGLASGVGSRISRFLGEKNEKAATNTAIHGLIMTIILAIIILISGFIYLEELLSLLGAKGETLKLSILYMEPILLGVLFMFPAFILRTILSSQGDTRTPAKIQITTSILNGTLDPILIYGVGLGIQGAALATAIAFFTDLLLSSIAMYKKSHLGIKFSTFHPSKQIIKEILKVGVPSSLMILLIAIYVMFINTFMAYFGIEYVAAFGIISRLESVATMPIFGLATALMTVIGMLYGAKEFSKMRDVARFGITRGMLYTSMVGAIIFIAPQTFFRIFTSDQQLLNIATPLMRIDVFTFPLMALSLLASRSMQGMGYGLPGLITQLLRTILVGIPVSYLFVFILGYGYLSVGFGMLIGGAAAAAVAGLWLKWRFKKHLTDQEQNLYQNVQR